MLAFALALLADKPAPPVVAPAGPWYVRAEENMCLLERRYPIGEEQVTLLFRPLLDLPTMEMYVIAPGRGDQYDGQFEATVGSDGTPFTGRYFSVITTGKKVRVTRLSVERRLLGGLKDGDQLHIKAKPVDMTFKLAKPEKARDTLKTCNVELQRSWGIDPETSARAVSPLEGNPARYFGPDAYPREALQKGIYGRVIALLSIDAAGTVTGCRIVSSAGPALNDGTCKAAARIRFKPPVDQNNKPLSSNYLLPVRWVLPGSPDY